MSDPTSARADEPLLRATGLVKTFPGRDGAAVHALRGVSVEVPRGGSLGVIGFSGAGKSTLVRCLNLLERPDAGTVEFEGRDLAALPRGELMLARRRIGMVFQGFNLLMQRTALENVLFPLEVARVPRAEARRRALAALDSVGLADKSGAWPAQLSGGQKQRVAIARVLVAEPAAILCDEATSALDPHTAAGVLRLLRALNRERGIALVVITHSMSVARVLCDSVAVMEAGLVVESGPASEVLRAPKSAAARRQLLIDELGGEAPGTPPAAAGKEDAP